MVQSIEGAFERNLAEVSWMDDAARAASRDKLRKIDNKIGYPEKWRDYSTLRIGRESLLGNVDEAARSRRCATWPRSASRWTATSGT